MEAICAGFTSTLQREGVERFLTHTSSLNCKPELQYSVHPFLFGMDTNLSVTPLEGDGSVQVYCGVLRGPLQAMLASSRGPEYEVYHAIKLLGTGPALTSSVTSGIGGPMDRNCLPGLACPATPSTTI